MIPTAFGTNAVIFSSSAAVNLAPAVALDTRISTSPSPWSKLVRNEFFRVSVVIWMPTSKVTPRVTARMALMFFVFLLPKALQAMVKLAFRPVKTPPF
jgi:hypothetical protein